MTQTPSHHQTSVFWTLWLLVVIVAVGLPGCLMIAPFIVLGRWYRLMELAARRAGCAAIRFMFSLNVWLKKDVRLNLPADLGHRDTHHLLVANHRSNLDVFFLISHIPNIRIVAKWQLFFVPGLFPMMWVMRMIPFRRGRFNAFVKALHQVSLGIDYGDPVLMFPEGRRCDTGFAGCLDFHLAPFALAFDKGVPVIPIVFVDTDLVWPKGSVGMNRRPLVRVLSLEPIDSKAFGDAKSLMEHVRAQMIQCLENFR